ncbi:MAG TPA: hypothetical protein VFD82_24995 [Planctomycetota bacterium]|nr:hypothetical protein [Planctomycetota bacterium]
MRFDLLFVAALATGLSLPAQFQSVTMQSIGAGCNIGPTGCCAVVGGPTTLTASLDPLNNQLRLNVNALEGCCGVAVPLRLLVLGTQPAFVPLPGFGGTCVLHVAPVALFATTADHFLFNLPPLPPLSFLAQAAAYITTPWPGPGADIVTFTDGVAITLQ